MRGLVDVERLRRFMRELGAEAERPVRVYFTGGATAVLGGWRGSTIDVDLVFVPEEDRPQDRGDVEQLIARGLVEPAELLRLFEAIEPQLYRFPAVDPPALRKAVEAVVGSASAD